MSKVFEALQRCESEKTGLVVDQENILATDFLNSVQTTTVLERYARVTPDLRPEGRVVCLSEPISLAAEKFRLLSVRIRNIASKRTLKRILVTSALPAEGKSVCAVNLAVSLSKNRQKKTLLIEGDLRRPNIRQSLGLEPRLGLTEWLRKEIDLQEAICRVEPPGMWFLPAGKPTDNPLEIMQPARLAELFKEVSDSFDWIVIDSTPVVPLADTALWARYSDGVLLVTCEGVTEKRPLKEAVDILGAATLVGVVFNGRNNKTYGRHYHNYYYSPSHPKNGNAESK